MNTQISFVFVKCISLIMLGLITMTGCKKLDEIPPGVLDPETYFQSQEDALAALTGAYGGQYGGAQR